MLVLESQKFVNNSKIEKQSLDKDNKEIKLEDEKKKNNKKKLTKLSTGLFENKKIIDELYITINKANEIFLNVSIHLQAM